MLYAGAAAMVWVYELSMLNSFLQHLHSLTVFHSCVQASVLFGEYFLFHLLLLTCANNVIHYLQAAISDRLLHFSLFAEPHLTQPNEHMMPHE